MPETMSRDISSWGVACNICGDKAFRDGAKLMIVSFNYGNASENMECVGLSKGGRRIKKWVSIKRLSNFRPSFCHENAVKHFYESYTVISWFQTKEEAQKQCESLERAKIECQTPRSERSEKNKDTSFNSTVRPGIISRLIRFLYTSF